MDLDDVRLPPDESDPALMLPPGPVLCKSIRYHFSNKSEDIKALYCESLHALGIAWTRPCDRQIAVYRKSSVAILDGFIGPKR